MEDIDFFFALADISIVYHRRGVGCSLEVAASLKEVARDIKKKSGIPGVLLGVDNYFLHIQPQWIRAMLLRRSDCAADFETMSGSIGLRSVMHLVRLCNIKK